MPSGSFIFAPQYCTRVFTTLSHSASHHIPHLDSSLPHFNPNNFPFFLSSPLLQLRSNSSTTEPATDPPTEPFTNPIMQGSGDLMKRRNICVLGSRAVGQSTIPPQPVADVLERTGPVPPCHCQPVSFSFNRPLTTQSLSLHSCLHSIPTNLYPLYLYRQILPNRAIRRKPLRRTLLPNNGTNPLQTNPPSRCLLRCFHLGYGWSR